MEQEDFALRGRQRRQRSLEPHRDLARARADLRVVVARAGNRGEHVVIDLVVVRIPR